MALINCPECGRQISDQAKNCPDCGYPIKSEVIIIDERKDREAPAPPTVVVESKEGCFLQTLNIGCIVFLVIIVLLFLFVFGGISLLFG